MTEFLQYIYNWYTFNKRDLPWRNTRDPYKIWLSEIILQQTKVQQGISYYLEFINKFPTIQSLAKASEDEILKSWQGLGYYSRARNLHFTAKFISNNLNGKLPENYQEIIKLKGIGTYTAAAIASIAFNLPYPAVDGNVYRFLSRYFGIYTPIDSQKGKKEFYEVAKELTDARNPGFHNQALMEFGALQCVPKSPRCEICPVAQTCYAYLNKTVGNLPVKLKGTKQRVRFFYYYLIEAGNFIFLEKRTEKDIWQNLYQFPLLETEKEIPDVDLLKAENLPFSTSCKVNVKNISVKRKHVLSHQIIYARLVRIELATTGCLNGRFLQVNKKDISTFAVPKLVEQFLREIS